MRPVTLELVLAAAILVSPVCFAADDSEPATIDLSEHVVVRESADEKNMVSAAIHEVMGLYKDDLPTEKESLKFVRSVVDNPGGAFDGERLAKCIRVLETSSGIQSTGVVFDNENWLVIVKELAPTVARWESKLRDRIQ